MADDGMLINFDMGAVPIQSKQKFTGGNWRDRLAAKKAAAHKRSSRPGSDANGIPLAAGGVQSGLDLNVARDDGRDLNPRPLKKQRTAHDHSRPRPAGSSSGPLDGNGKPKQIVSSLFSFNPKARSEKEATAGDAEPSHPSNAPLDPELETFTSLGLSPPIAELLLRKMEIKAPTAIQRSSVSQLVKEDTDAFIQAQTGSGKTLAYLLPIVQRLFAASQNGEHLHRDSGLFAIILAPTRELSKQIYVVLDNLLRVAHWLVSGTVIGGEKKKSEKARLRKGLNILIATPGRLADHVENTKNLDVGKVKWLVLDEGDRLMEMGFEQDIEKILKKLDSQENRHSPIPGLPAKRMTILCSATLKSGVQKLGEISLKNAVHIHGDGDGQPTTEGDEEVQVKFSAPAQLQQSYAIVPAKLRLVTLAAILRRAFIRRGTTMKAMVFISCADSVDFHFQVFARKSAKKETKDESNDENEDPEPDLGSKKPILDTTSNTDALATALSTKGNAVRVFRLHGSLPQAVRTSTLNAYRDSTEPAVLICTDVASRGLDLPNVDFVVEYDPAFSKDDHLHRVGRTARAGKDGRALIFLQPGVEESYIGILKEGRQDGGRNLVRHQGEELVKRVFAPKPGIDWEEAATTWQLDIERWALEDAKMLEMARRAYQSHIRAYATHVAPERHIFDIKELHLGHLAKAFALRDKPGSINVPGMRPGQGAANANKMERKANAARSAGDGRRKDLDTPGAAEPSEAAKKMRKAMKAMSAASEFNLG